MKISIPKLSLVVLIGPSGSGKSTFARKHFLPTEVLSSDACRGMVSDDENNQAVTNEAFEVLHYIAAQRLALGRLTVIDATNVQPEARKPLVELARKYHCLPVAIVLNLPERLCQDRNRARDERDFGPHVIRQQHSQLRRSLRGLGREGFRHVFVLESARRGRSGHGRASAAVERQAAGARPVRHHRRRSRLLRRAGSPAPATRLSSDHAGRRIRRSGATGPTLIPRAARRSSSAIWWTVARAFWTPCGWCATWSPRGSALCVPGNHDMKLMRKLRGKDVQITHGLANILGRDRRPARRSS